MYLLAIQAVRKNLEIERESNVFLLVFLQYPNSPEEFDMDFGLNKNLDSVIDVAKEIKDIGNTFFKEKEFAKALKKYKKALR